MAKEPGLGDGNGRGNRHANGNGHGNGHGATTPRAERPLRIALLVPPMVSVPPTAYGGTERVVSALEGELVRRGHQVTVFASGDSLVKGELVATIPQSLWRQGYQGDISSHLLTSVAHCWREAERFDLVHSHAEGFGFLFARYAPVPVLTTLHGRLDVAGMPELLAEFTDIPLVALSESHRRWAPDANWVGVVNNGLPLEQMPFAAVPEDYLIFVGRVATEKGIAESIELAQRTGVPLKVAAKAHDAAEQELYDSVVAPAVEGEGVEFLGELSPGARDPLFAHARATLMLGGWPEPFGLVAIESLASGTPVIARRAGALPEIIRHGRDGFLVDDLDEAELAVRLVSGLDRKAIRERALERFSSARMTDQYEAIYRRLLRPSRVPPASDRSEVLATAR